ncbi:hypothetical protein GCM10023340_44280 [Nocardioides marinquilinus]|uniref:Uncharacterized protein n=1 Tax=Nocardioides marinquilinus TaxID=1210400 RepID=A0ABP9Q3Z2_9ACTN
MVLLWLVPPVVVTVAAMVWVAWLGREGRGEVDRDEALRRMTAVLDDGARGRRARASRRRARRLARTVAAWPSPRRRPERSTGVVVRRAPGGTPARPATGTPPATPAPPVPGQRGGEQRRAS